MKLLQNEPKLIEVESRLKKQSYLSRGTLPASSDAKMFLFLESIKSRHDHNQGYPDRKMYPNLYHWYVLMKQFATSSLEKWISNSDQMDEDQLIDDFILRRNQKIIADAQIFKKNIIPETLTDDYGKTLKTEQLTTSNCNQIEYIMDVKIKEGTKSNMKQLIVDFLEQEQLEAPDVQQLVQQRRVRPDSNQFMEERRVRIVAKMDPEKYEELKNKISALEGVETFESKKKDKRFMTGNSSNNFLAELGSNGLSHHLQ